MERVHLSFALGKDYEDQQDFATSFSCYQQGNQLKKAQSGYNADRISEELKLQREFFAPAVFERNIDGGHPEPDPIFIVGLPRAGSTMLERILSSHSQVDGTLELPNILSLAQKLRRKGLGQWQPFSEQLTDLTRQLNHLNSIGALECLVQDSLGKPRIKRATNEDQRL